MHVLKIQTVQDCKDRVSTVPAFSSAPSLWLRFELIILVAGSLNFFLFNRFQKSPLSWRLYTFILFSHSFSTPSHSFTIRVAFVPLHFVNIVCKSVVDVFVCCVKEKAIHWGDKKEQWYGREEIVRGLKK